MYKELELYIKQNLQVEKEKKSSFRKTFISSYIIGKNSYYEEDNYLASNIDISSSNENFKYLNDHAKESSNIDEFIKNNNMYSDFQTTLFKMIDERNLIDSDVYNKVHLDRRLFSKIRNNSDYHPSKETVILLGLSLELSEDEIEKLLDSASYSLPRNNHYDLIIRFGTIKV